MAADKYQVEARHTFEAASFNVDRFPDAHFNRLKNGKPIMVTPKTGLPDYRVCRDDLGAYVEVKTGRGADQQRFDFGQFDADKRRYYVEHLVPTGNSLWFFITLGSDIRAQQHHRITLLLPAPVLLEMEQKLAPKKSFNYAIAAANADWLLMWAGNGTWSIPVTHPFYEKYIAANGDRNAQRDRTPRLEVRLHGLGKRRTSRGRKPDKTGKVQNPQTLPLL